MQIWKSTNTLVFEIIKFNTAEIKRLIVLASLFWIQQVILQLIYDVTKVKKNKKERQRQRETEREEILRASKSS